MWVSMEEALEEAWPKFLANYLLCSPSSYFDKYQILNLHLNRG